MISMVIEKDKKKAHFSNCSRRDRDDKKRSNPEPATGALRTYCYCIPLTINLYDVKSKSIS